MNITTHPYVDMPPTSREELDKIVAQAGQDVFLNDGEGTVPNAEYRVAIACDEQTVGFFSPYVFDLNGQRYWRAGPLYLKPECRGKGIMREVLKKFFELQLADFPGLVWIDDENASSIKLFVGLGFQRFASHPAKRGTPGHWYTYTAAAEDPVAAPSFALEEMPSYLRW